MAKTYNKRICEKMQELMASGLVKKWSSSSEIRYVTQEHFESEKAKRSLTLAKIAKQQQDLMEVIVEIENVQCKISEEGAVTINEIESIENNIGKWAKSLEEEEDRKRREAEEAEKKERERRAQEAEERKRLEEEKTRKEAERDRKRKEEKRKLEEEKRRKEEEERKRKEEEMRRVEEKRKEEEKRKMEEDRKRKEEEERKKKEEELRKFEEKRKEEEKRRLEEERRMKEEQMKRQEEERIKEEERKRIDTERKLKEEETKRRKEEERKMEIERKRRRPENWPIFIYERSKDGKEFHKGVCCVVSAIQGHGGLVKDDLCCTWSDADDDLYGALSSKEERIQSSVITVKYGGETDLTLDEPMRIYVPYNRHNSKREMKIKMSINGKCWENGELLNAPLKKELPDIHQVGTTVNNFSTLQIAIVSRPIRENFIALVGGNSIELPQDRNCKLVIPPKCFPEDTGVHIKTLNVNRLTKEAKELNNIKVATSHGVEFDRALQACAQFEMYPNIQNIALELQHQKALEQCKGKLETDMSTDNVVAELQRRGVLDDKVVEDIKSKESDGTKARRLLKEFQDCDNRKFEELIQSLEKANQGHLVTLLKKVANDIKEEETSSDYLGPVADGDFQVVSSQDHGDWKVMETNKVQAIPDAVFVSLPIGGKSFEIIGLVVPKNLDNNVICRAAEALYSIVNQTPVRLLCKQNVKEPHDILLQCVPSVRVDATLKDMKLHGFVDGPMDSAEFGVCEGEDIYIKPTGNLKFDHGTSQIKMRIFINMDSAKSNPYICPANKKAQVTERKYHGQLCYNIGVTPESPPRSGSLTVFLPKEDEYSRYAPLSLNASLRAMAKFLAHRLTEENPQKLSDFYKAVAGTPKLLRTLQSRVTKESTTGSDRDRCELFILCWANQRPKCEEKVNVLIDCLRGSDTEMVVEAEKFHQHYSNGVLSNNYLERIGTLIGDRWEILAEKLFIDSDKIEGLKIDFQDHQRRAVAMLDQFRLSDTAAEHGGDVGYFLLKSAEYAGCNDKVLQMIRDTASSFC